MGSKRYLVWVRWESGEKDVFELTKEAARKLNKSAYPFNSHMSLEHPDGSCLRIHLSKSCAWKVIEQTTNTASRRNPLNEDNYYDNPLS